MKKTNKIPPNFTNKKAIHNYLIGGLALATCYLVFNANPLGVFDTLLLLQSFLSADVALGYISYTVIILVITTLVTGLALRARKVENSQLIAFVAVAIHHLLTGVVFIYAPSNLITLVGVAYAVAVVGLVLSVRLIGYLFRKSPKRAVVAGVACAVVLICIQPYIVNPLSARLYIAEKEKIRSATKIELGYKVYYPAGSIAGITVTKPFTNNYPVKKYADHKPTVVFNVGDGSNDIKVVQGGAPANQSEVMNHVDRCDVRVLYGIFDQVEVPTVQSDHPCAPAFTTPSGRKVYQDETSARPLYFTQIDNTDIFFEWQSAVYERGWPKKLDATITQVVDSLEEIDASQINLGYDIL